MSSEEAGDDGSEQILVEANEIEKKQQRDIESGGASWKWALSRVRRRLVKPVRS